MRQAIVQPGVRSVAIAWPLLVLAHFALFTCIAPFIREAGLPDYAISLSLTVLGASGLIGIWTAGVTVDSRPRRSLLITTAAVAVAMLLLPLGGGTMPGAMILMTVWGAGIGAIGIYNQAAILRAGREDRDAANGLTVLTIQVGITIGALYGSAALVLAGPLMVPVAAAVPVAVALVITLRAGGTPTRRAAMSTAGQTRKPLSRRSSTSSNAEEPPFRVGNIPACRGCRIQFKLHHAKHNAYRRLHCRCRPPPCPQLLGSTGGAAPLIPSCAMPSNRCRPQVGVKECCSHAPVATHDTQPNTQR